MVLRDRRRVEALVRAERQRAFRERDVLVGIAAIHRRAVAYVPVGAADDLVLVLRESAAGIRRDGVEDFLEGRQVRRELRERSARRAADLTDREHATRRGRTQRERREERLHVGRRLRDQLRGRNERDARVLAADAQPLGGLEELKLVLHDGTANRIAELVARQHTLLARDELALEVRTIGRERRDAVELVDRAVKLVRAGLVRHIDDAATGAAVFGREVVRQDRELLN